MSVRTGFLVTGAVVVALTPGCTRSGRADSPLQDASITTEIRSSYLLDAHVDCSRIGIRTRGGEVTLTGSVSNDDERRLADRMARDAFGVRDVVDHLEVRP
jgi:osmotically-inducible protein OsmY